MTGGTIDDAALSVALTAHLRGVFGQAVTIADFRRRSAGFSWITCSFVACESSGRRHRLILRVAPPRGLFAPYSIWPQVLALQAFANSGVLVPGLTSYAQDGGDIGLPFFICEHVDGDVPAPWADSAADENHRLSIARQFIDILARIHSFDWRAGPLSQLDTAGHARPERCAITSWRKALSRETARYYPLLDWGGRWLETHCPTPPRTTIVHGDYRIGNFLEDKKRITAILDWELVHPGDPHEDVTWALMPTFNAGSRKFYGVMERELFIDRYQTGSGITLSPKSLAFYEAYALYQAAAIQMRAVQAAELDRFNDMRMTVMSTQMASIVRAFDRALEKAA